VPTAHREPFFSARENIEFWAGQRFRLRAASYHVDLPKWDDYVSWLPLMQHHCVPTRLLDWTENVLVALYFAVSGNKSEDGELWCMNHGELNWRSANWKACFPDTPPIRYLAAAAFLSGDQLAKFAIEVQCPAINGPLALVPPFQFPRMAVQMSRFTIHPSTDSQKQIESLLRGPSSLVRYIVPATAKRDLAGHLARLGFSHETLYRSLDALGRTIRDEVV
jgi:FRG domain